MTKMLPKSSHARTMPSVSCFFLAQPATAYYVRDVLAIITVIDCNESAHRQ